MDYPTSFSLMFFFSWSNVGVRFGRAPRALFLAPEGRPRGQLINPPPPGRRMRTCVSRCSLGGATTVGNMQSIISGVRWSATDQIGQHDRWMHNLNR